MQRWQKALLAGVGGAVAGYAVDFVLTGSDVRRPAKDYALGLIPAALMSAIAATITYAGSRPAPGEGFPEKV